MLPEVPSPGKALFPHIPLPMMPPVPEPGGVIPPPPPSSFLPANSHIRAFNQFVIYKIAPSKRPGEKPVKLPCDHRTGMVVNAHDPKYWTDYEAASRAAATRGPGWGVGFTLTPAARLAVVDMDGCRDPQTGVLSDMALFMISILAGAYVEVSVSGTGIHIWFSYSGEMPGHAKKATVDGTEREFYHERRFFALGTPYGQPGAADVDMSGMVSYLIPQYFPPEAESGSNKMDWSEGHELGWELPDDAELIRLALNFAGGASAAFGDGVSFADLWTRNVAKLSKRYPSDKEEFDESDADLALAGKLAWLTGNDCPRIEKLMRQSFLARSKWDSHKDYLCERTIMKGLVTDGGFYYPKYKEKKQQETERRREQIEEATRIGEGSQEHLPAEVITLEEMLTRYLYIEDGDRVQDLKHPRLVVPFDQFVKSHRSSKTVLEVEGEFKLDGTPKTKSYETARLWEHGVRNQIKTVTFRPGALARTVDPDGNPASNTWRPIERSAAQAGDTSLFLNHVKWLFGADAERFLDWLAHIEQRPGDLPHTAWLHISLTHGKGRNWLANTLCRVWEGHVANNFNLARMLKTGFDGRLSKKLLVVVDEIHEGGSNARWDSSETLKQTITADTRELNPKYGFPLVEWNKARWLMFSNHVSAVPLDNQDRRFEVVKHEGDRMPNGYYEQLWAAVKVPGFIAGVAQHLLTRDIRDFNPGAHALMTEAKRDMVAASRSEADEIMADIIATHPADVITTSALGSLMNHQQFGGQLNAHQRHALDRAGVLAYGKQIWVVGKPVRVRILRNHEFWKNATPPQVQAELAKGMGAPPVIT